MINQQATSESITFRAYDSERDRLATRRIWREIGWITKDEEEGMSRYVEAGRALVAEVNGEAECLVCTGTGSMRYLNEDLPFVGVTGVTTSRIARKQGLAGRLLARALAEDVRDGALVAGLGMFEQGYYNHLGFGTFGYEHIFRFDPAHLTIPTSHRIPNRITCEDYEKMHAARLRRRRVHGSANFDSIELSRAEMEERGNSFGIGYYDTEGNITHALWVRPKEVEKGPYRIQWMVWNTREEFLELLSVVKSWGDQVHLVGLAEPPSIQIQDLIRQPIKHREVTGKGSYPGEGHAIAYMQARILDVQGCLEKTRIDGPNVRFNLRLTDPVERFLDPNESWRGIGGDYIVTLGPNSSARRGEEAALPTLTATVNAFTRLWLGVRPAVGLAITDDLAGPPQLLEQLDRTLRLPNPSFDWDF
jgi:hypothetical protein